jgi:hypothetical protein
MGERLDQAKEYGKTHKHTQHLEWLGLSKCNTLRPLLCIVS